jgi:hypothetical protein
MLREGREIICNCAGAVNSTIESVELTQREGLLAIARFRGGGRGAWLAKRLRN